MEEDFEKVSIFHVPRTSNKRKCLNVESNTRKPEKLN